MIWRLPVALKTTTITVALLAGAVPAAGPAAAAAVPAASQAAAAPRTDVTAALRALEASFKGRIGAYAIDTATGKTIGYRAGERFPLLSTFKAVAAGAVLARTTDRELTRKVVHWTADEVKSNSPETGKHVKDGMTLAELCRAAIIYSDNTAGNMLLKRIGGPRGLTRYFRTLKDPVSRLDRWETDLNIWSPKERRDTTTPASVARDLRVLTTGGVLGAKDRSRLIGWLRDNTTGDARIRAGLPKTWIVGDKTGTGGTYGTANDIAVIWPARNAAPIIMAIYTNRRAADGATADSVVARTATLLARGLGRLS
ncbi:class A beta-lactamase [Microbispora sp. SCL1-1]|uniref:class A beta-lactamase n=1 Tax=unclassified Microbispora TaxID=2614687 RepID=UPI00115B6EFA|nr:MULTISPECIES: class A beta-lactamase [unclassified Microbispora]NJP28970.1 class A beta-lactamase [Microbispora sp. CL1-1]TQS06571.1 class A beta-lactamase [Microbispora sp. SCL1-1]